MKRQLIDLTGKKFGFLSVVKRLRNNKSGAVIWECVCDCGNIKEVVGDKLRNGRQISCGCFRRSQSRQNSPNWKGYQEISSTFWGHYTYHAYKRNIEFNLTMEYAWKIFLQQNSKCSLTGIELEFGNNKNNYITTASIDRIDSSKGYIENNIHWVHKIINIMKNTLDLNEFINWCNLVVKNNSII